ncbi:radical SAM protein [Methanobrevibacter acididurans]|uniref:radical SAM protein n=1 Tax=Methanobrevibacter acididurans TaxID=120963 RepID=UPI0038FC3A8A
MLYEKNFFEKNPMQVDVRVALTYPNDYKTAMSNLGYQIVYGMLNDRIDMYCERVVMPFTRSIETGSPLHDFDVIAFSLQYEEDYFNVLKMLDDAGIPLRREDRGDDSPIIMAGGPCASSNPSVLSDYIDIFIVGEGEEILDKVFNRFAFMVNPHSQLESLSKISGVYLPGITEGCVDLEIVDNMNHAYYSRNPIITETDNPDFSPVFGEAILLNISRGCSRGCRFCMSSYLYRPQRERSVKSLVEYCESVKNQYGLNRVAFIGAAVSDYSDIEELISELEGKGFEISVPSMRIESITHNILVSLKRSGLKTLTIAPESIYRLRTLMNKDISDEEIFNVISDALSLGFNVKSYFLIGLPTETDEDIEKLITYIKKINELGKEIKNNDTSTNNITSRSDNSTGKMSFSINPVIPKPHTPLQWYTYDMKSNKKKIKHLKKELGQLNIKFSSARIGLIQYILACGDHNTGKLLEQSLTVKLSTQDWLNNIPSYELNDNLPWDNINVRADKEFLKEEYNRILNNELTPWCEKDGCYNCGPCKPEMRKIKKTKGVY